MEYFGKFNLKQYIKGLNVGELLDEGKIVKIIMQICLGLKDIHNCNIIHRDLTPENIFIDENNNIKIGDFGVSTEVEDLNILINDFVVGKPGYIAPEMKDGKGYNSKVDIYVLGCIIYELFTLKEYNTDNNQKKIRKIDLDKYNIKFQSLIDKLLNNNYEERPNIEYIIECIIPKNEITLDIAIDNQDLNKNIYFLSEKNEKNNETNK